MNALGVTLAVAAAAFAAGVLLGMLVARALRGRPRARSRITESPGALWRALTEHEISFLRRVWRVGFVLEDDETLWRDVRPERVNATLHDLEENRRLVYLDRVRGSSQKLKAYRLTAAGKTLMTWVTHTGK
jgi:uncharacterized protein YndB with AHSA1/START domain